MGHETPHKTAEWTEPSSLASQHLLEHPEVLACIGKVLFCRGWDAQAVQDGIATVQMRARAHPGDGQGCESIIFWKALCRRMAMALPIDELRKAYGVEAPMDVGPREASDECPALASRPPVEVFDRVPESEVFPTKLVAAGLGALLAGALLFLLVRGLSGGGGAKYEPPADRQPTSSVQPALGER
jgi:hypothetical protein